MKICIIGTGYVGLTEGLCFVNFNYNVSCFDMDKTKNRTIIKRYSDYI